MSFCLAGCSNAGQTPRDESSAGGEARRKEVARLKAIVQSGTGRAARGQPLFTSRCGACHTFKDQGGKIGPNLTHYVWDDQSLGFLLNAVLDPNSELHEHHTTMQFTTTDGKTITGIVAREELEQLTIIDSAGQSVNLPRSRIQTSRMLMRTLMPDHILSGLSDQQTADLFAWLMSGR
jgi:putative heme-binding domain-containing protein